ncbi:hypothetical protein N0U24_24310, partial [Peribacillus frigoritolerans]|nr:hypothetical protein [Peribacillus frigoritolerans]
TWVVRCTAVFGQGAGRCGFNHWSGDFSHHWRFNHGRWFNHWRRLGNRDFCNRCWRFFYHRGRCWRFNRGCWLGRPLEGGLFFANFTHFWSCFDNRGVNHCLDHWLRFNHRCRLNGSHFSFWLGFVNLSHFHFWNHWGFDWGSGFDSWSFY